MKSGLKAAGEELVFGIYDGVTGLVVQPYTGARDHGSVGFVRGVGIGLTSFVLKDLAAIFGPVGYTFKGIHKELLKGRQPTNFIRKARILEGQRDLQDLDAKERKRTTETVAHGWSVVQEIWAIMVSLNPVISFRSHSTFLVLCTRKTEYAVMPIILLLKPSKNRNLLTSLGEKKGRRTEGTDSCYETA